MAVDVAALPDEVQRFERWLAGERRASAQTSRAYLADLAAYVAYLSSVSVPVVPSSPSAVRGWLGSQAATNGPTSIGSKLSTVRTFYRFLVKERVATLNPARLLISLPSLMKSLLVF